MYHAHTVSFTSNNKGHNHVHAAHRRQMLPAIPWDIMCSCRAIFPCNKAILPPITEDIYFLQYRKKACFTPNIMGHSALRPGVLYRIIPPITWDIAACTSPWQTDYTPNIMGHTTPLRYGEVRVSPPIPWDIHCTYVSVLPPIIRDIHPPEPTVPCTAFLVFPVFH